MTKPSVSSSGLVVLPTEAVVDYSITITPLNLCPTGPTHLHLMHNADDGTPLGIVELHSFAPPYGSFMMVPSDAAVAPHLCRNGNITFVTRVDPLFSALPLLYTRRADGGEGKGVFQPLSALLETEDAVNLSAILSHTELALLCDVKSVHEDKFYRLSDVKTLAWLKQKHDAVLRHPHVGREHALNLVASYLSTEWADRLRVAVTDSENDLLTIETGNTPEISLQSPPMQTKGDAAELEISNAMAEERENKEGERARAFEEANGGPNKLRRAPLRKAAMKAAPAPSPAALKFWAAQNSKSGSAKSKASTKRKRTAK